jgi:hypothetical protein
VLVGSNLWWFFQTFDHAITDHYREDQMGLTQRALDDALLLAPLAAAGLEREELISEAERLYEDDSFEKDSCVWVGNLGLKFDEDDRLIHVSPSWSFLGDEDPCFTD